MAASFDHSKPTCGKIDVKLLANGKQLEGDGDSHCVLLAPPVNHAGQVV